MVGGGPTAVGLHIYSGAFTCGVQKAGWDVLGQWEEGDWGAKTFELNFPRVPHPLKLEDWPVSEYRGRVSLVMCNPPCAPWSVAGARLGMRDPRLVYTDNSVNAALKIEPDFFVWESVCRAYTFGREKVDEVAMKWRRAGYAVTILLTNAILHGTPQWRERFHFIAHRYKLGLRVPQIDVVPMVRSVIGDIEHLAVPVGEKSKLANHVYAVPGEREVNVLERLGEGEGWDKGYQRAVEDGVPARKARFICGRLWYDSTCRTLADVSATMHPTQSRAITIREAARLSGYPDGFVFAPQEGRKYGWSGGFRPEDVTQAVMPPVGEYLARQFSRALDVAEEAEPGEPEVIDWRPLARPLSPGRYAKAQGLRYNKT